MKGMYVRTCHWRIEYCQQIDQKIIVVIWMRANLLVRSRDILLWPWLKPPPVLSFYFYLIFFSIFFPWKSTKKCRKRIVNTSWILICFHFLIVSPTRHYGALQGLDKQETVEKYGKDQVNVWRRWESEEMKRRELNRREMNGVDREIIDERGAVDGEKKWKRRNKTEQCGRKGENEYDWGTSYSIEMHEEEK